MDRYRLKQLLLKPYTAVMSRTLGRAGPIGQAFQAHNFGPAFVFFFIRGLRNPGLLHIASVDDVRVIVDAGAFDGDWSLRAFEKFGAEVYAFEPSPLSLQQAEARLAGIPQVHLMPYALGASDGEMLLVEGGMGSTLHDSATELDDVSTTPVAVRDIAAVFDELGLERVDLIKINIEGGEYDLLDRLIASGYIERCRCLLVQFHEWHPDAYARRRRIRKQLRDTHTLDWSHYFVWERWTRRGEPPIG